MRLPIHIATATLGPHFQKEKPALAAFWQPAPISYYAQSFPVIGIGIEKRLEVQFRAELIPARVADRAVRLPCVRIGTRHAGGATTKEIPVTADVVVVRGIEDVESESDCGHASSEAREILPQPHIEVPVRESARHCKSTSNKMIVTRSVAGSASRIDRILPTESCETGPLYPKEIRNIRNPVPHDVPPLIVRAMLGDCGAERECKRLPLFIEPLKPSIGVRDREPSTPTKRVKRGTAVRPIQ
jgi:hypothetical protein